MPARGLAADAEVLDDLADVFADVGIAQLPHLGFGRIAASETELSNNQV
jgi:hypothetical protein